MYLFDTFLPIFIRSIFLLELFKVLITIIVCAIIDLIEWLIYKFK